MLSRVVVESSLCLHISSGQLMVQHEKKKFYANGKPYQNVSELKKAVSHCVRKLLKKSFFFLSFLCCLIKLRQIWVNPIHISGTVCVCVWMYVYLYRIFVYLYTLICICIVVCTLTN